MTAQAVVDYYAALCEASPAADREVSWEACWKEYVDGGLGRWRPAPGRVAVLIILPLTAPTNDRCALKAVATSPLHRWMWMLPVLATMCPPKMTQYFHDQVLRPRPTACPC